MTLVTVLLIIAAILAVIFSVVWGFLHYVGKASRQPMVVTVRPVVVPPGAESSVPAYIRKTTEDLQKLGFSTFLDFTVSRLPHKGLFRAMVTNDFRYMVIIHEIYPTVQGKTERENAVQYMEFESVLTDDTKIDTCNAPLPLPMEKPPGFVVTRHPGIVGAGQLFDKHREIVEQTAAHRSSRIKTRRPEGFIPEFERDYEISMLHNVRKGLLKLNSSNNEAYGTARLVIRYLLESVRKK